MMQSTQGEAQLRSERDIVLARQLVRRLTQELAFSLVDQTKMVTAASELARNALVYGRGGTSAKLFTMLASVPIVPLPGAGEQRIQTIHVADLVDAIVQILGRADTRRQRVALVGPRDVSFRDFMGRLRGAMGLRSTRFLRVPAELMRLGASIASAYAV